MASTSSADGLEGVSILSLGDVALSSTTCFADSMRTTGGGGGGAGAGGAGGVQFGDRSRWGSTASMSSLGGGVDRYNSSIDVATPPHRLSGSGSSSRPQAHLPAKWAGAGAAPVPTRWDSNLLLGSKERSTRRRVKPKIQRWIEVGR